MLCQTRRMRRTAKSENPVLLYPSPKRERMRCTVLYENSPCPRLVSSAATSREDRSESSMRTGRSDSARSAAAFLLSAAEFRVTQDNTARLGRLKARLRALRDHAPLLLGKGRVDVQRERIDVAPNAVTRKGTRCTIRLAMNATSRDKRSSFATATWHFAFFAAFSAARSCGLRSSASLPLPVSTSVNSAKISKPSASANATTARRCACEAKAALALLRRGDTVVGDQLGTHGDLAGTIGPPSTCPKPRKCQAS